MPRPPSSTTSGHFSAPTALIHNFRSFLFEELPERMVPGKARFIQDLPGTAGRGRPVVHQLFADNMGPDEGILLATPYLIPLERGMERLRQWRRTGATVKVIVPSLALNQPHCRSRLLQALSEANLGFGSAPVRTSLSAGTPLAPRRRYRTRLERLHFISPQSTGHRSSPIFHRVAQSRSPLHGHQHRGRPPHRLPTAGPTTDQAPGKFNRSRLFLAAAPH